MLEVFLQVLDETKPQRFPLQFGTVSIKLCLTLYLTSLCQIHITPSSKHIGIIEFRFPVSHQHHSMRIFRDFRQSRRRLDTFTTDVHHWQGCSRVKVLIL